ARGAAPVTKSTAPRRRLGLSSTAQPPSYTGSGTRGEARSEGGAIDRAHLEGRRPKARRRRLRRLHADDGRRRVREHARQSRRLDAPPRRRWEHRVPDVHALGLARLGQGVRRRRLRDRGLLPRGRALPRRARPNLDPLRGRHVRLAARRREGCFVRDGVAAQLDRRRRAAAERWNLDRAVVLIGAGTPIPVPGRGDRTYLFRSHSEYLYLTDRERPGGVLAFDPEVGWVDFVAPVTRDELLWSGAQDSEEGVPVSELRSWLEKRPGRRVARLGAPVADVSSDAGLESKLRYALNH